MFYLLINAREEKWKNAQLSRDYSDTDKSNALMKIMHVAHNFEGGVGFGEGSWARPFQCRMEPADFGLQLQKSFGIFLSQTEVNSRITISNRALIYFFYSWVRWQIGTEPLVLV